MRPGSDQMTFLCHPLSSWSNYIRSITKGKFAHYDFCNTGDVRMVRWWQRDLLATEHKDFLKCDNPTKALGRPPSDAHRLKNFEVRETW